LLLSLYRLDSDLLENLGVRCYPGPVRIPLYAQKQLVYDQVQPIPGMVVSRVVDVSPELQSLMAIILQIEDGSAFRRLDK
jgi:hypothetical protein